jgi:hypothetical protein
MYINPVNNYEYNNEMHLPLIDLWIEHGRKLGATHALLYFDRYDRDEAMRYVFPGENLNEVIRQIESEHQTVIKCWQYT